MRRKALGCTFLVFFALGILMSCGGDGFAPPPPQEESLGEWISDHEQDFGEITFTPQQGGGWSTEQVDNPANAQVGWATGIKTKGPNLGPTPPKAYINYYDILPNKDEKLAVGQNGGPWALAVLDGPGDNGRYGSIALPPGNDPVVPRVSYYGAYKQKAWNGAIQIVDATIADFGAFNDIVRCEPLTSQYNISYVGLRQPNKLSRFYELRHAQSVDGGTTWAFETLLSVPFSQGSFQFTSIACSGILLHISFRWNDGNLGHAWGTFGLWNTEKVLPGDKRTAKVQQTSIEMDLNGWIHIVYNKPGAGIYRAVNDGSGWQVEFIASGYSIGTPNSLAINSQNLCNIAAYNHKTQDLVHFWKDCRDLTNPWNVETIDAPGDVGKHASITHDEVDCKHIAYFDDTNDSLKYATNWTEEGCLPQPECPPGVRPCRVDADCDDGNICTDDYCGPEGCCHNDPICDDDFDCIDGNICTDDWCDGAGCCHNDPECEEDADCDDGNICTTDWCDDAGCCHNDPECEEDADCDDGDLCTIDWCDENGCCQREDVVCDDGNPCTEDFCNPDTGECEHIPECTTGEDCFDGDLCTIDWCDENGCCQREDVDCDDGNPCTEDFCNPDTGECEHIPLPDGTICGPGGECHRDICQGGYCVSVPDCLSDEDCPDPDPEDKCAVGLCNAGCCAAGYKTCAIACCDTDADCPDDGNICTQEFCDSSGCCQRQSIFDGMCFPPQGIYCYWSAYQMQPDWNFDGEPDDDCWASGDTVIQRGERKDDDHDGQYEIPTEIVSLTLSGNCEILGPINVTGNGRGEEEAKQTDKDYPAESFFDVFFRIEFPDQGVTKFNKDPDHKENADVMWPYNNEWWEGPPSPVLLYREDDPDGPPVGQILFNQLGLLNEKPCGGE